MKKLAIIDLGTNSLKVLHIEAENIDSIKVISKEKHEVRIAEGLETHGNVIQQEPLERVISVLKDIKANADATNEEVYIFSTEVMRKALNANEVVKEIEIKTGIPLRVLSHEDEAKVFWHGATYDFPEGMKIVAIDIGGGSVQLMYGTKDKLEKYYLFKTGALVLRERFIKSEPATEDEWNSIEEYIEKESEIVDILVEENTPIIHGSGSVIDFYKEANFDCKPYAFSLSHPLQIDLAKTEKFYNKLKYMQREERIKYFPSDPAFMDGAGIGLANLLIFCKRLGVKYELPSNKNINEGLIRLVMK